MYPRTAKLEQWTKTWMTFENHLDFVTVTSIFIVPNGGYVPIQFPSTGAEAPFHFSTGYPWVPFVSKVMLGLEELQV